MLTEPGLSAELAPALEARILLRITNEDVVQRQAGLRAAGLVLHLRRTFDEALRARIHEEGRLFAERLQFAEARTALLAFLQRRKQAVSC